MKQLFVCGNILIVFLCISHCSAKDSCDVSKCPVLNAEETCVYPKEILYLPDPNDPCCNRSECICVGTSNGLSTRATTLHMQTLIERYTNCTIVDGNLEIVSLATNIAITQQELDNAFKAIKEVSGYVLISLNKLDVIKLPSLRLIRGTELYSSKYSCQQKIVSTTNQYSLEISGNNGDVEINVGVKEIHMPVLTEIMSGNVKISANHHLCYLNTILWRDEIVFNPRSQTVEISDNGSTCAPCASKCKGSCWSPTICQSLSRVPCNTTCANRCNSKKQCCSEKCAAGCMDDIPLNRREQACYACRDINDFGVCTSNCQDKAKLGPDGVPTLHEVLRPLQLSKYCVDKCPITRRKLDDKLCVSTCPVDEEKEYYDKDGVCKLCEPGECDHICHGLSTKMGPLRLDSEINAYNIGNFTKNCTIIEGSLIFRETLFKGDDHCGIPAITGEDALSVFENVEEITGFLSVEYWNYKDLCIFKNLKRIRGHESQESVYSLMISTHGMALRELCLNSLQEIVNGDMYVLNNRNLCQVKSLNCKALFANPEEQRCMRRKNSRTNACSKCNPNCLESDGCWGEGNEKCLTCLNYTDYTNDEGKFVDRWVFDNETQKIFPGHNVTRCVEECDVTKRVYATTDNKCFPCHDECQYCNGPDSSNCTALDPSKTHGCRNFHLNGDCVTKCPDKYYVDEAKVCQKCNENCRGVSKDGESLCTGALALYGEGGCSYCFYENVTKENMHKYVGLRCPECDNCAEGCTIYGEDKEQKKCIMKSSIFVVIIVTICIIIFIILVGAFIFFRHRKTISKMRKHIGDNLLAEREPFEDLNTPLTPSGTAPNQAQLRIVKENELTMGKELGSGAFGAVYKALWTPMHIENEDIQISVAVKKLKIVSHSNEIMDEAYVMASVDSLYLVRLLGICMTEHVSLITQLMPLGSLLEYVKCNYGKIGSKDMLTWCLQIAKGMLYLEEKHLVHRDLAARNVLLKTPRHAKITDFGLAKMLSADQHEYFAEGGKLPIKWLALECITERKFSHQSDVWAYGVTCWEIFTLGQRPYEGVRAVDVFSLLERGDRLTQPHICTIDVYMLLVKCWMVDPLSRPRFSELMDEFSKMLHDPVRYLVIEGDPGSNMMSPKPYDEKMFFRKLLEEDELAGNVDDPDEYLLSNHLDEHVEYENQETVEREQTPFVKSNGAGPSGLSHPNSRHNRLFSRNTSSAYGDRQSSTVDPQRSDLALSRTTSHVSGNSSAGDDVFANDKSLKGLHANIPENLDEEGRYPVRIDSEENSRYTEDPTLHKSSMHDNKMQYDDDDYLLPTPNQHKPDYFDPSSEDPSRDEEETLLKHPTAVANDTYINTAPTPLDSPQFASNRAKKHSKNHSAISENSPLVTSPPEYVNTNDDHEYMNDFGQNKSSPITNSLRNGGSNYPSNTKQDSNFFANEEYMATDSGIGDETRTSLTRKRDMSLSSVDGSSSNGSGTVLKSNQSPEYVNSSPPNYNGVLNNPEYMMLHDA